MECKELYFLAFVYKIVILLFALRLSFFIINVASVSYGTTKPEPEVGGGGGGNSPNVLVGGVHPKP